MLALAEATSSMQLLAVWEPSPPLQLTMLYQSLGWL